MIGFTIYTPGSLGGETKCLVQGRKYDNKDFGTNDIFILPGNIKRSVFLSPISIARGMQVRFFQFTPWLSALIFIPEKSHALTAAHERL